MTESKAIALALGEAPTLPIPVEKRVEDARSATADFEDVRGTIKQAMTLGAEVLETAVEQAQNSGNCKDLEAVAKLITAVIAAGKELMGTHNSKAQTERVNRDLDKDRKAETPGILPGQRFKGTFEELLKEMGISKRGDAIDVESEPVKSNAEEDTRPA